MQEKLARGPRHVERLLEDATLIHAGAKRVTIADTILAFGVFLQRRAAAA